MSLPSLNKVITYLRSDHDQTPERSPWCPSTLWYHNQERAHSTCHQVPQEQKQRPHFTQSHKERKIRKAYLAWNLKKNYRGVKPHSFVWYSSQRREEQRREEQRREEQRREEQQRGNGATRRGVEPCDHRFWENSFLVRSQAGDVHVHPSTGEVLRTVSTHCLRNCQREWQAECPIWHIFFRENSFGSIGFAPNSDSKIVEGGQNCSAKSQQNAPP